MMSLFYQKYYFDHLVGVLHLDYCYRFKTISANINSVFIHLLNSPCFSRNCMRHYFLHIFRLLSHCGTEIGLTIQCILILKNVE